MSTMRTGSWEFVREGLRLADALITFQRFPKPAGPFADDSVRSHGALRPERANEESLLPLAETEAFWIGALLPDGVRPAFHAVLADGHRIALSGAWRAPLLSIMGFSLNDVLHPLTRPPVRAIDVRIGPDAISITIVAPEEFSRRTGCDGPDPLDHGSAYKGWRLP